MNPTPLEIVGEMPKSPLLVVGSETLALVDTYATAAKLVSIESTEDYQAAAQLLANASDLAKTLEASRETAKAPFLQMGRKVDDAVRPHATRLTGIINNVRVKISDWRLAEERRRREEEEARQRELARLERERRAKEEEAARIAEEARRREAETARLAEEARKREESAEGIDLPTPEEATERQIAASADDLGDIAAEAVTEEAVHIEQQIAALQSQKPAVIAEAPEITFRTVLKHEVFHVGALPRSLVILTPNDAEIRRL